MSFANILIGFGVCAGFAGGCMGWLCGRAAGYNAGREDGWNPGYAAGYETGRAAGKPKRGKNGRFTK